LTGAWSLCSSSTLADEDLDGPPLLLEELKVSLAVFPIASLTLCCTLLLCRIVPAAKKGNLTVEELPLPSPQRAEVAVEEFMKNWEAALVDSKSTGKQPKLLKVSFSLRACQLMPAEPPEHT
jgi:hypothetical protein